LSAEPQYHVASLAEPGAVEAADLGRVFLASWTEIAHLRLAPGERLQRPLTDSEAMVFVLGGAGTARLGELTEPLREGISLTLFQGEPLDLEAAADQGLDLFLAEMNVDS
jgi:mannose-6-phosphate isomerase-like protein (cupin superfamily)